MSGGNPEGSGTGAREPPRRVGPSLRLVVASTLITASFVLSAFLVLSFQIRTETRRFFAEELIGNQRILLGLQAENLRQLLLTSTLMTQSPTLRAAMETYRDESATGNLRGELLATIQNESRKIVAGLNRSLLVVTDEEGRVLASSGSRGAGPAIGDDLSSENAVRRALHPSAGVDPSSFAVMRFGEVDFQAGCVPIVLRNFTIGVLILGDVLDSTYVHELQKAMGGEVVIRAGNEVLASTLPAEWTASFRAPAPGAADSSDAGGSVQLGNEEFVAAALPLGSNVVGSPVVLYLLRSLPQAMAQVNRSLFFNFVLYGSLAVLLAGAAAGTFSARLSRTNADLRREMDERERVELALHASEAQLRDAQKLEAIGTLAGGLAHNFNNLLSVVLLHTDLLLEEADPGTSMHEDLKAMKQAGERAADLTAQLLAFGQKQLLQPEVFELHRLVSRVEPMVQRLVGKQIELRTEKRTPPARANADPGEVEQAVITLAVNARDAMAHGGRLTIVTENVQLSAEDVKQRAPMPPGSWALLSVIDTGAGMDEATRSRLFDPFFTTKGLANVTGLGLAGLYGAIKQSGGYVWVSSELGRGTAFNIYLPQVPAADDATSDGDEPANRTGPETITKEADHESESTR